MSAADLFGAVRKAVSVEWQKTTPAQKRGIVRIAQVILSNVDKGLEEQEESAAQAAEKTAQAAEDSDDGKTTDPT